METQGTSNSQNSFEKKKKKKTAVKHPDFKIYNKATVNKTVWY